MSAQGIFKGFYGAIHTMNAILSSMPKTEGNSTTSNAKLPEMLTSNSFLLLRPYPCHICVHVLNRSSKLVIYLAPFDLQSDLFRPPPSNKLDQLHSIELGELELGDEDVLVQSHQHCSVDHPLSQIDGVSPHPEEAEAVGHVLHGQALQIQVLRYLGNVFYVAH